MRAMLLGVTDTLVFLSLPIALTVGSQSVWDARYHLSTDQQRQIELWAGAVWEVAFVEDVPPVVPLVLWYKEGGLKAENPDNCEGIMGLHTAVTSGKLPCFPRGPVGIREVLYQLQLGARTFKSYCPDIHYTTTDPKLLKLCYLRYNAGPSTTNDPDQSAYVMNGYSPFHQNMVHVDAQGRRYPMTSLGAWPVHLSIQAQLAQREKPLLPLALLSPSLLIQEGLDRTWVLREQNTLPGVVVVDESESPPEFCRSPEVFDCFVQPHLDGNAALRPQGAPLLIAPVEISNLECGLMPGITLAPPQPSLVLSPITGTLTRYSDSMGHLAVQIENEEWTVWLTGLRSYTGPEGLIEIGDAIGAVSGVKSTRTPGIHYTIYDRVVAGFVDPLSFIPADGCGKLAD
ncbi:MAG: hypothetical protein JXA21_21555 [Anaerolineae bacterium]|nr:hypothetical protein [Anaerolineae bacterium]